MSFVCEKCGKNYAFDVTKASINAALKKARECCGQHTTPCLDCFAKNFCENKDPEDPKMDGSAARIKMAGMAWDARGCK